MLSVLAEGVGTALQSRGLQTGAPMLYSHAAEMAAALECLRQQMRCLCRCEKAVQIATRQEVNRLRGERRR